VSFGRPLRVDDGRKHFLVHPFLFQLTDPAAAVTLNWENEAYDWVAPRWVMPSQILFDASQFQAESVTKDSYSCHVVTVQHAIVCVHM
jgi:hypothetical protein